MRILATPLLVALVAVAGGSVVDAGKPTAEVTCSPTSSNRPVCPAASGPETASFLDPTSVVIAPRRIHLAPQVYVAPFAGLDASRASIHIGPESNVQDNVAVVGGGAPDRKRARALARLGLDEGSGVETGERVILAHGSRVVGPARLGVSEVIQVPDGEGGTTSDSGVFVSFGAEVDGAILERDSGLSALARVGPGVRLPSGFIVLPGKNVTTQAQAQDPALGKVRPIVAADRVFNAGVVEVNVGLAREYTELYRDDPTNVTGINYDPGGNVFDESRDLPRVESDLCTGPQVRRPHFPNRVIGDACFADSLAGLRDKMSPSISIRADEGGPFGIGTITRMGGGVIFHALEGTDLRTGDNVTYGAGVIVHGGGRPQVDPTTGMAAPTLIGDNVVLGDGSIVFRSLVRNGASVGTRSAVVGSELALGQVIPDRVIYANDGVFGPVEW
jgi:carbonic anhydrase/acetyltransferase-like protein (isoleucine patch superfamily)